MGETEIIYVIGSMALVTAASRVVPAVAFGKKRFSKEVQTWLKYIPVSLIAALLFPEMLISGDKIDFSHGNLVLWVSIPTGAIALKTRSIALTVISGCALAAVARLIFKV